MTSTTPTYDHYIYAAHMRRWATDNRVIVLRRGGKDPKALDIGKAVAAEQGLNEPSLEAEYGKVEDAFNRALRRVIDSSNKPTNSDWQAIREYAVLVHDRYPGLRGLAVDEQAQPGGNTLMVPNPAHWGSTTAVSDRLANLATIMNREQLKFARLQLLPIYAKLLPPVARLVRVGPMMLGDAGIHAITLHQSPTTARTYVAMPLSPEAMVVFGNQAVEQGEAIDIASALNMKIAMESTVVVDTMTAPLIRGLVAEMWRHQLEPAGVGLPQAINLWKRVEDIRDL